MEFDKDTMINHREITEEDCDIVEEKYFKDVIEIKDSDDQMMKVTLVGHIKMIEERADFTKCQKTARRKIIIAMWHNIKVAARRKKE